MNLLRSPPPVASPMRERPQRIFIATDAWSPQVNGVVRTLETLCAELSRMGHDVGMATPAMFKTAPLPTYNEIRLALWGERTVARLIEDFKPQTIHIATEGPIGFAARRHCLRRGLHFTTSFHTRFPEYINARARIPESWTYRALRWFHAPAKSVMVATPALREDLKARGFQNLRLWSRGVDVEHFRPRDKSWLALPRPVWLYVGRLAVEKNVEAFLKLDLPGSKLIVGDGPQGAELRARYPEANFVGAKFGEDLARYYAAADVFVFPSRTDTFGLVLLEAMASGLPVAAFPVQGPRDVIGDSPAGALRDDLREACMRAMTISPNAARAFAMRFSWEACTRQFLNNLAPQDAVFF